MKNYHYILFVLAITVGVVSFNWSEVKAALSKYGFPGIYNVSNFTLSDGSGSAISVDANGRVLLSPSSTIAVSSGSTLTVTSVTSTGLSYFQNGFISSASSSVGSGLQVSGALNASGSLFVANKIYAGGQVSSDIYKGQFNSSDQFGLGIKVVSVATNDVSQPAFDIIDQNNREFSCGFSTAAGAMNCGTLTSGINLQLFSANTGRMIIDTDNNITGFLYNSQNLGTSIIPWKNIFSGGTITIGAGTASSSFTGNSILVATSTGFVMGKFNVDSSGNINASGTISSVGGSAGKATCWKADGKTIGYCSSVVDVTGGCTCN